LKLKIVRIVEKNIMKVKIITGAAELITILITAEKKKYGGVVGKKEKISQDVK